MWSLSLIQGAAQSTSNEVPWYNAALLAAVFTAVTTFVAGQISAWQTRKQAEQDRKQAEQDRRVALLWAFYAEATVIRNELRPIVEEIATHDKSEQFAFRKLERRALPTLVYKENAKFLGEIGDSSVVQRIVTLYSRLESTAGAERLLGEAHDLPPEEAEWLLRSQWMGQVAVFGHALYVTELISELLKNLGVLDQGPAHEKALLNTFREDRERFPEDDKMFTSAINFLENC
jgi:hypothetical protein